MKVPFQTTILIESPLPMSECEKRLRDGSTSKWSIFKSRSEYPYIGKFEVDSILLRPRLNPFAKNSWTRIFKLKLHETPGGCRLEGKIALPNSVLVFSSIWCGFVFLFLLSALSQLIKQRGFNFSHDDKFMMLVPLGMLLFFALMTRFGLWMSGFSERRVIAFIEQTLHGRVVDIEGQSGLLAVTS